MRVPLLCPGGGRVPVWGAWHGSMGDTTWARLASGVAPWFILPMTRPLPEACRGSAHRRRQKSLAELSSPRRQPDDCRGRWGEPSTGWLPGVVNAVRLRTSGTPRFSASTSPPPPPPPQTAGRGREGCARCGLLPYRKNLGSLGKMHPRCGAATVRRADSGKGPRACKVFSAGATTVDYHGTGTEPGHDRRHSSPRQARQRGTLPSKRQHPGRSRGICNQKQATRAAKPWENWSPPPKNAWR